MKDSAAAPGFFLGIFGCFVRIYFGGSVVVEGRRDLLPASGDA